jgi:hypothetical protein
MNPQDLFNFCKSKTGKMIIFGGVFAGGMILFGVLRKHHTVPEDAIAVTPLGTNIIGGKPQVVQSVVLPMQVFHPPAAKPEGALPSTPTTLPLPANPSVSSPGIAVSTFSNTSQRIPLPAQPSHQPETLPPICIFADSTAGAPRTKKLSAAYAPFGRLISCETIVTVDSSSMQTPIIGLVTENIYHAGKLIIPAGTEVHGTAKTDHQRERIASGTSWTLVWQNGEEMQIKAIALDREFASDTNQTGWAITDGSAGLRGELIKSDNLAEIKLFAATFLSGAAGALTEKQQTIFGPINSPSLNNAPLEGAQDVLKVYAQQISDSIQKDGFYVRVPSGKQFYLYVLQTLDRADASIGGADFPIAPESEEPTKTASKL